MPIDAAPLYATLGVSQSPYIRALQLSPPCACALLYYSYKRRRDADSSSALLITLDRLRVWRAPMKLPDAS